jgi:hypothetical protein
MQLNLSCQARNRPFRDRAGRESWADAAQHGSGSPTPGQRWGFFNTLVPFCYCHLAHCADFPMNSRNVNWVLLIVA